jgi:hypothetical protein
MRWFWSVSAILLLAIVPALAQKTYSSPVAYCKTVGTIDKPDARYVGPKLPAWMAKKLNLQPDQGKMMEWRCANGAVLACLYGANIPCDSKANTSQKPTAAITEYCKQNPDSTFVPAYVTGHDTIVSWGCKGPQPQVKDTGQVDAQGYAKQFWQPVSP